MLESKSVAHNRGCRSECDAWRFPLHYAFSVACRLSYHGHRSDRHDARAGPTGVGHRFFDDLSL